MTKSKYMTREAQQSAIDSISKLMAKIADNDMGYTDQMRALDHLRDYRQMLIDDSGERFRKQAMIPG